MVLRLIKAKRYKLQLGNVEAPKRWFQKALTTSMTHLKAPGTNETAPIMAATAKPAITCVASDEFLSSVTNQTPNVFALQN